MTDRSGSTYPDLDVMVVGAGFSGLYLLHQLRQHGFTAQIIEAGGGVGGTWYWNRYPGARCDIVTTDYAYSFDPELEQEWQWSEKYATQPEILAYLDHVADRYQLRSDIRLSTRVEQAIWQDTPGVWQVRTDQGDEISCRFLVMATGCLSLPKTPDIEGAGRFAGEVYFTGRWPHQPVDFRGKRVGVIGTGSSGIQCIPLIAAEADELTVFQRTASFSVPAHNGPAPTYRVGAIAADRDGYRERARHSPGGVPVEPSTVRAVIASEEERRKCFEAAWEAGELVAINYVFADQAFDPAANEILSEMIREKIRAIAEYPQVAEDLSPRGYPFGTKRPCLDTDYVKTFNLPHVHLVNLRRDPIVTIEESSIRTQSGIIELDVLVYATGYDAMTGPIVSVDIRGRDGQSLAAKWAAGPSTYLGLTTNGFPNFFTVTGPGSPSVLSNMVVSIEQHVEWISRCLDDLRADGFDRIEPTPLAEGGWNRHVQDCAALTLFARADSWYMGANVPGKPRTLLPYTGGVGAYRAACDEVADEGYLGFELSGPGARRCNDGIVRRLQPDVALVVAAVEAMDLAPIESMAVPDARARSKSLNADRPLGPDVGDVVDGEIPTAVGDLPYRLYYPLSAGPHPTVVYFHGGGFVLGDLDTDDPLCRDLCVRSDSAVISVNYLHAPEHPFPLPATSALAAVQWVASNAEALRLTPGRLAVAGYSAGGNLAAVASQLARDTGAPSISGQVLLAPVTDCDLTRPSYRENGTGYVLTAAAMKWFWDHHAPGPERFDPTASPLRGNLAGLPPATIVTAEFDPLADEGAAYAEALARAGVPVEHIHARGHIHTSIPAVGVIRSGEPVRAEMALALRRYLGVEPS